MRLRVLIIVLFAFFSCNENLKNISKEEENSLNKFLEMEVFKNSNTNYQGVLLYLVLRDCTCVEENINFVKETLSEDLNTRVVLVVKPDVSGKFLSEFKKIQNRISDKVNLIIDYEEDFFKYGNLYVTDKLFIIQDSKVIEKIELKKENFKIISNILF